MGVRGASLWDVRGGGRVVEPRVGPTLVLGARHAEDQKEALKDQQWS